MHKLAGYKYCKFCKLFDCFKYAIQLLQLKLLNTTSVVGFGHECKFYALQLHRLEFLNTTNVVGFGHKCKFYAFLLLQLEFSHKL